MITKNEIEKAISELEAAPMSYSSCEKLACFYTIRNNLFAYETPVKVKAADIQVSGDSEFVELINQKNLEDVFVIMDELMEALKITNSRLYDGVLRKLEKL